jgi:hypothetical protein
MRIAQSLENHRVDGLGVKKYRFYKGRLNNTHFDGWYIRRFRILSKIF